MVDKNRSTSEKNIGLDQLRFGPYSGVYIGEVVDTEDLDRAGRMRVRIPMLSGDLTNTDGVITCQWSSPFAGSTPAAALSGDVTSPVGTQKSYGMWMVPPDVGNLVLVCFGDGNLKHGIVISCLFPHKLTHMVPGMPAGLSYSDPNMQLPVNEKNKRDGNLTHNDATRPLATDLAEAITLQGLANDSLRGTGSSGSRRESPSQTFGFLTPGPKDPDNSGNRLGGHQFVMDDSIDSRLIRLRTAGGNQILMDDTVGVIYLINKSGSAWVEMDASGSIQIFGETSINMRTKGNFNIRADKNVNIEAGQDVQIKAAGDNINGKYKGKSIPGIPPLGSGGNIRMEAAADLTQYASLSHTMTAFGGDISVNAAGELGLTSGGPTGVQVLAASGPITMSATQRVSMLGGLGVSISSSGSIVEQAPLILMNSGGDPAVPAKPAPTATRLGTIDHTDAAEKPPEFDREAVQNGKTGATSGGLRVGKQDVVSSIVSTMLTREPYIGHAQFDPVAASAIQDVRSNPDVRAALAPAAVDQTGVPVDVNTPTATAQGSGYLSATGEKLEAGQNLAAGIPQFDAIPDVYNNFKSAQAQELLSIGALNGVMEAIQAAIPPIRFPTTTALGQKIVGLGKTMTEYEAQLQAIALNAQGITADLNSVAISKMRSAVGAATSAATGDLSQLTEELGKQGISVIEDGGSVIYEDANGNRVLDLRNGIGPIGSTLAAVGDLNGTWQEVNGAITVPVSENQSLALAHFADSIGAEAFLNSDVLAAVNNGQYEEAPRLMQAWNLGRSPNSNQLTAQGGLSDLRSFQTSLFQHPDEFPVGFNDSFSPGESSFSALGSILRNQRHENFAAKLG